MKTLLCVVSVLLNSGVFRQVCSSCCSWGLAKQRARGAQPGFTSNFNDNLNRFAEKNRR